MSLEQLNPNLERREQYLQEASEKLHNTPSAEALWRIGVMFSDGAIAATLSDNTKKKLKETADLLESLPEIKAMRKLEEAMEEMEEPEEE